MTCNYQIEMSHVLVPAEIERVTFYINTALCQSPPGISKTAKAIQFIKHFGLLARANRGPKANGTHHMTLVLTNNSLPETEQWKYRLEKNMDEGINSRVISSKKEKGDDNFKNLGGLITSMVKAKTASDLPDMLVMCTHAKRTDDVFEFLKILKRGNVNFTRIGVHRITLTIMFDEADKNIALIVECLKQIDKLLSSSSKTERFDDILRDIHFITATPFEDFWKSLSTIGLHTLKNLNTALKDMDPDSVLHMSQKELMTQYRYLTDHHHRKDVEYVTDNPVEYAAMVLAKIREEELAGKREGKLLTIFAPGTIYVESHTSMKDMFLASGITTVLIMNGKNKGFYSHEGIETIKSFNDRNKVNGELKDTLVKWRQLNPASSLAITGNLNVERGITFCTSGFNFTDLIVCHCHIRNLASLIQLLGRANGGKEFVEIMNIWAHTNVVQTANDRITIVNELLSRDPEEFKERDFRKMSKHEFMEPAMSVPIVITLTPEIYSSLTASAKKGRVWDEDKIIPILELSHTGITEVLKGLKKYQISEIKEHTYADGPKKGVMTDSYKKHIADYVAAASENRKFVSDIKPKQRHSDVFQMFLDPFHNRVIVSLFHGRRIPTDEEENDVSEDSDSAFVISHV
jgi:hypothetical protein